MREAQRAPGIAERPSDLQDQGLNRRLAAEAKSAANAYVKTALVLDSQLVATTVGPGIQQLRGATKLYSSFTDT
jgi:hypothetical protein